MKVDKNQIKEIIAEALEIEASEIGDSDNFVKDLAMNSLVMLDCVSEIEDLYDIRVPKADIHKLNCIDEIIKYLENME